MTAKERGCLLSAAWFFSVPSLKTRMDSHSKWLVHSGGEDQTHEGLETLHDIRW